MNDENSAHARGLSPYCFAYIVWCAAIFVVAAALIGVVWGQWGWRVPVTAAIIVLGILGLSVVSVVYREKIGSTD